MLDRLVMAGSGGQGVVLAGKLLATVAVRRFPHVTFFPSYGAEVRGGTSSCQIMLSDTEIASPIADQFDSLLLMNDASVARYTPSQRAKNALVIVNATLCPTLPALPVLPVPASEIATRLGGVQAANFVMLGAYQAIRNWLPPDDVAATIQDLLPGKSPELLALNLAAFHAGREWAQTHAAPAAP